MTQHGETYNRTRKATRLANVLEHVLMVAELPRDEWRAHVEGMGEAQWERIATISGDNPPSDETRSAVLAVLDERVSPADPFVGLTTASETGR